MRRGTGRAVWSASSRLAGLWVGLGVGLGAALAGGCASQPLPVSWDTALANNSTVRVEYRVVPGPGLGPDALAVWTLEPGASERVTLPVPAGGDVRRDPGDATPPPAVSLRISEVGEGGVVGPSYLVSLTPPLPAEVRVQGSPGAIRVRLVASEPARGPGATETIRRPMTDPALPAGVR